MSRPKDLTRPSYLVYQNKYDDPTVTYDNPAVKYEQGRELLESVAHIYDSFKSLYDVATYGLRVLRVYI